MGLQQGHSESVHSVVGDVARIGTLICSSVFLVSALLSVLPLRSGICCFALVLPHLDDIDRCLPLFSCHIFSGLATLRCDTSAVCGRISIGLCSAVFWFSAFSSDRFYL